MLGPILELMLDAIDMAATVVVLLALWDGRDPGFRRRLARWLSGPPVRRSTVEQFLAAAKGAPAARLERGTGRPAAGTGRTAPPAEVATTSPVDRRLQDDPGRCSQS